MERVKLGLTKKSQDQSGAAVAVGPMQFSIKWLGRLPGAISPPGSLFQLSFFLDDQPNGREWRSLAVGSDYRPDRSDILQFCVDTGSLTSLYLYMDTTLSNTSVQNTLPTTIKIFDGAHTQTGTLSFDFRVSASLGNNIFLFGFTHIQMDLKGASVKTSAFSLTSMDAEGIFVAIDGVGHSNWPSHPY